MTTCCRSARSRPRRNRSSATSRRSSAARTRRPGWIPTSCQERPAGGDLPERAPPAVLYVAPTKNGGLLRELLEPLRRLPPDTDAPRGRARRRPGRGRFVCDRDDRTGGEKGASILGGDILLPPGTSLRVDSPTGAQPVSRSSSSHRRSMPGSSSTRCRRSTFGLEHEASVPDSARPRRARRRASASPSRPVPPLLRG